MVYFIIVYGSYGITYSKGKGGNFHCPQCAEAKAYRHRRVRRFFHIFFIPLIPLTLAGEYVECGQCKGTYKLEVLDAGRALASGKVSAQGQAAPPAVAPESHKGVRRILAMMMLADGKVEESEIEAIVQYLSRAENRAVPREEVLAEFEAAKRDKTDAETYCRNLMGYLNLQGRRDVLAAAHMVASADGHVDPNEQRLLERLGIALGLRPSEVSTALAASQIQRLYQPGGGSPSAQAPAAMPAGSMPQVGARPSVATPAASMAGGSMPGAAPRAPFCPRCGTPGRWIVEHGVWGCDRCRAAIPTAS